MVLDGEGGFLSVCMFIFLGLRCHPRTGKAHSLDQTLRSSLTMKEYSCTCLIINSSTEGALLYCVTSVANVNPVAVWM